MQNDKKQKLILLAIIFFGLFGLAKSSLAVYPVAGRRKFLLAGFLFSFFLFFAGFSFASPAYGADYYFAQSVAGSANGTSCANAYAIGDGSSTGASSSTYWVAGNTLHLCGTITGSAGATAVSASGSGTSGSPITIKFESGASLQAPYWGTGSGDGAGAITLTGYSYITIDGGATGQIGGVNGNAANVNGYIENTSNGTSGSTSCPSGSCSYQEDTSAIYTYDGSTHITVKNLAIYDMYVRTSMTDENAGGVGVNLKDGDGAGLGNILVTNCLMHDMFVGIGISYGADSNFELSSNTIYNVNWGGNAGDRSSGSILTGLLVHDNWIYNFSNWNDIVGDNYHHNGFYAWAASGGTLINPMFYNNKLGPGWGGEYQTSGLWADVATGAAFFNNLFVANSGESVSNALIQADPSSTASNFYIANNTFILNAPGGGSAITVSSANSGAVFNIKNNLAYNSSTSSGSTSVISANYFTAGTINSNYNLHYGYFNGSTPFIFNTNGTGGFTDLAGWQSATGSGNDSNDVTSNPNLSSTYKLQSGSPAIGAGANLTSLSITALNSDLAGTARPSSGAWDIGAYKYSSGSSDTIPPAAPTGLTVQ
jgi:hypothetical protein